MTWKDIVKIGYIPSDANKKEVCSICGKKYSSLKELVGHQREEHADATAPVPKKELNTHPLIERTRNANKKVPPRMGSGRAFTSRD